VTTFFCMAALAGQQWARPVRREGCTPQCGGDCHVTASAAANGADQDQTALAWQCMGYHGSDPVDSFQNEPDDADVPYAEECDEYGEPSVDVERALKVLHAIHSDDDGNTRKQRVGPEGSARGEYNKEDDLALVCQHWVRCAGGRLQTKADDPRSWRRTVLLRSSLCLPDLTQA